MHEALFLSCFCYEYYYKYYYCKLGYDLMLSSVIIVINN